MTPTPPLPPLSRTPNPAAVDPPSGGVGVASATTGNVHDHVAIGEYLRDAFRIKFGPMVYHLALCVRCGDDLAQPFREESDRDRWAAEHVKGTGHAVRLVMDKLEDFVSLHICGIISRDETGAFRYVCPADDCATSCGPFDTPELAIASWRTHGPARTVR